jgi:hypothetical protein
LVVKYDGKRPMGRPTCRWEVILRWIYQEVGCGGVGWIELAQEVEGTCECGNEPSGSIKCGKFLD